VALLKVDSSTCTQCGLCAAACSLELIDFQAKRFPTQVEEIDRECIRCGHCEAICPSGSLTLGEVSAERYLRLEKSLEVTFAQASQLIKARRSIREFKDKRVSPEEIERIIDVARYAPTGHNAQGVQWLIITNPDLLRRMSQLGLEWMRWAIKNIPVLVPIIGRMLTLQESGKDTFLNNAPAVVISFGRKNSSIAPIDCAIATAYFDLAAVSAGLGCCWNGLLLMSAASFPAMVEAVGLPEGHAPYGCLMLGYPKYKYPKAPDRKPANIISRI
jgi:nitroreductase/NAD-dependent dihydropyrimidine dehydrogenase PreA subunit